MKKYLVIVMAAVLSVSLSLFACKHHIAVHSVGTSPSGKGNASLAKAEVKGVVVEMHAHAEGGSSIDEPVELAVSISETAARDSKGDLVTVFTPRAHATAKTVFVGAALLSGYNETAFDKEVTQYDNKFLVGGGAFFVKVTAENGAVKWYRITVTVEPVPDVTPVTVQARNGDDRLTIAKTGGTYHPDLKVFVANDGTAVKITTEDAVAHYSEVAAGNVVIRGDVITVNLEQATPGGGDRKLNVGNVNVTLAADAQLSKITSILASSFSSKDIGYTVISNGNENTTTTVLKLEFDEAPHDLVAGNIHIENITGVITHGAVTGSGKVWTIPVTAVTKAGIVAVKVKKGGVTTETKTVHVHRMLAYKAEVDGIENKTNSTKIMFTFDEPVADLHSYEVIVTSGTATVNEGNLSKSIAGNRTVWTLEINNVSAEGTVKVQINKPGAVDNSVKIVHVHRNLAYKAEADGAVNRTTSTKIMFTFDGPVADLHNGNITLGAGATGATKGNLSKSIADNGKVWALEINNISAAGPVTVQINKPGVIAPDVMPILVHKTTSPPGTVAITNGAIASKKGVMFSHYVTVALTGETFRTAFMDENVLSWIISEEDIGWLSATGTVSHGRNELTITLSGTPTEPLGKAKLKLKIPAAHLSRGEHIIATEDFNLTIMQAYTVTYHPNGASGTLIDEASPYYALADVIVKNNIFMRSGYVFTGWNTRPDGNGKAYGEHDEIKDIYDNITFYAQWISVGKDTVTVKFDKPADEINALEDITDTISWKNDTSLTVTVVDNHYEDTYEWYLNGKKVQNNITNTITFNAKALAVKQHTLAVVVTKRGVQYSKSVTFTVTL